MELLSDQNYRIDGRKPSELRRIRCKLGVFQQADGSAYIEQGNTKVLAAVYGPHEPSPDSKAQTLQVEILLFFNYHIFCLFVKCYRMSVCAIVHEFFF